MATDEPETLMLGSNVEDGHSSDNGDDGRAVSTGRATQYGKALLVAALTLAVVAGGAVVLERHIIGPSPTAAISQSMKLAAVGAKDLTAFTLRLTEFTAGKPWSDICTIYTQVQEAPCTLSAICPQEAVDLATYFKATAAHQAAIRTLILTDMVKAGVSCWSSDLNIGAAEPIGAKDLTGFTLRLRALTAGKPREQICPIYNQVQSDPCTPSQICLKETAELAKYFKATAADQPAIQNFITSDLINSGMTCWSASDKPVEPVGAKDLAGFTLRLEALTQGKGWTQVCGIYEQVKAAPCTPGPTCLAETAELSKYFKATTADQSQIQAMITSNTIKAGVDCR